MCLHIERRGPFGYFGFYVLPYFYWPPVQRVAMARGSQKGKKENAVIAHHGRI
jgi:hypothetical protein